MTAPAYHQIKNIFWPEVRRLYHGARLPIGGKIQRDPASGLDLGHDRGIICISTDKPEKIAGLSGENILILVDEGSGYPDELWEPLFGNMAGGGLLLTTGNPTRTSGPFYEAFANPEFWNLLHLSSENTPNVKHGRTVIPGLATREWVEERRLEWGEESAAYQVRVLGNFPTQAENAVIPMALAQAAEKRLGDEDGPLHIGVDVARFGDDDSVIQPRRGHRAYDPIIVSGADTVAVVGKVASVARELRRSGERVFVKVDEIGVGAGVVDLLRSQHGADLTIIAVNVAEKATAEGFAKLRDQLWFACRDWLQEGGSIGEDPRLFSELVAPTYSFDAQGRQKVESKDEIKKRLRRSPDRADALCLAVYAHGALRLPAPQATSRSRWADSHGRGFG